MTHSPLCCGIDCPDEVTGGYELNGFAHTNYLNEAEWRKYASLHKTVFGSDNGLSPLWHQAIIWTNAGIILITSLRKKLQLNLRRNSYIFIQQNTFQNAVCKIVAICLGLNMLNVCTRTWRNGHIGPYNAYILTFKVPRVFARSRRPFWTTSCVQHRYRNHW